MTAPSCDGCDAVTLPLTLFDNGKRYCWRCAEDVSDMGWAKPVRP